MEHLTLIHYLEIYHQIIITFELSLPYFLGTSLPLRLTSCNMYRLWNI